MIQKVDRPGEGEVVSMAGKHIDMSLLPCGTGVPSLSTNKVSLVPGPLNGVLATTHELIVGGSVR